MAFDSWVNSGFFSLFLGDSISCTHPLCNNNAPFSTFDNDNDPNPTINHAVDWRGAWWYQDGHTSNLNGEYGNDNHGQGINWIYFKGWTDSLSGSRMMLRRPWNWYALHDIINSLGYFFSMMILYIRLFTRHAFSVNSTLKPSIKSTRMNILRNRNEGFNLPYLQDSVKFTWMHFFDFNILANMAEKEDKRKRTRVILFSYFASYSMFCMHFSVF